MKNDKILKPKSRKSIPNELMNFGVHLVYSEGTKTEPKYVENIKKNIASKYNCKPNDIQIINANGEKSFNTLGLVNFAFDDVKKRKKQDNIDHVWIFFDKDDYSEFENAIKKIEKKNNSKDNNSDDFKYNIDDGISYHACYSNESFELWLCLYFDYINTQIGRDKYVDILRGHIGKYEKNMDNIHDILVSNNGSMESAIKNAIKLEENKYKEPSTGVYLFAEYFINYMKK